MADPIRNFFSSTLVGGYSDSDTELTLATGSGANLPDPSVDGEFNLVIYNESEIFVTTTFDGGSTDTRQDLASTNPEIVRVTARSGDVITVTRAQEGTTASAKASENTYRVILASTKKVFDDINDAIANVDLTTLTGVEELTFDSTGDEEFGLPAGTTAQRPSSPSQGYMRYNTDDGIGVEVYNGNRWVSLGAGFAQLALDVAQLSVTANDAVFLPPLEVEYLVIAGGGGGGGCLIDDSQPEGGGGGAGGYRSSVVGEDSGGGATAESVFEPTVSTNYTVTIGAGGAGSTDRFEAGTNGSSSTFSTITTVGGGGGGVRRESAKTGGSGGGGSPFSNVTNAGGAGTSNQGYSGGNGVIADQRGGGGGGAGAVGENADSVAGGDGGTGVTSSVTGSGVARAGGGGGASSGIGGSGGGGNGGVNSGANAQSGTTNSGGGGGGAARFNSAGAGSGGSGVVILRYPSNFTISIGAGLTGSETTDGSEKYAEITAGTGNVSWTQA